MTPNPAFRSARAAGRLATLCAALACVFPASAAVVISQVYGGGGNSGSVLKNDFIEPHNTAAPTRPSAAGRFNMLRPRATAGR